MYNLIFCFPAGVGVGAAFERKRAEAALGEHAGLAGDIAHGIQQAKGGGFVDNLDCAGGAAYAHPAVGAGGRGTVASKLKRAVS